MSSYHVTGMIDPDVTLDLRVTPRGETGTVTSHGITWHVLALDGAMWLQGRGLWAATLPPDRAAAYGDGWVRVTDGSAAFDTARILPTLPQAMVAQVFGPHPQLRVTATTTLAGRQAVELQGGKDIYDVAATGTPYPLRWLERDTPGADGRPCGITLDSFGAPAGLAPPSPVVGTLSPSPRPSPSG